MRIGTLAIVGVGLIGGSIGLAARRRAVADQILGIDVDPDVLERALRRGAIDEAATDAEAAARADLIVFCLPVDRLVNQVLAVAPQCRPDAILTDCGSTKAAILRDLEAKLPAGVRFVGGHPLAGSEKQGPDNADAELFEGRLVVLTPTAQTDDAAVVKMAAFWESLGAKVQHMTPADHDRSVALTSHLPHVVASALAGVVTLDLVELAASGFRDTTRVASGSPTLWTGILQANREAILAALDRFDKRLDDFRQALQMGDSAAIAALLKEGKDHRDALNR